MNRRARVYTALFGTIAVAGIAVVGGTTAISSSEPTVELATLEGDTAPATTVDDTTYLVKVDQSSAATTRSVAAAVDRAAGADGGDVTRSLGGGWKVVKYPAGKPFSEVSEELALQGVQYIQPNIVRTLDGKGTAAPSYAKQWYWNQASDQDVDAPEAWFTAGGYGAAAVKVAVIDTGVLATHPDLNASIVSPLGVGGGNGTNPVHYHGTAVASLIAGEGDGITGMAPGAKIIPIARPDSSLDTELIVAGLDHARAQGASIVNMSYGGTQFDQAEYEALRRANDAGILLVASSGNESSNNDLSPKYPANYDLPMILTVGASTKAGGRSDFSNYGAQSVDIAAPGGHGADPQASQIYVAELNNAWKYTAGTSFSAPIVAGIAAHVKSKYPASSMYSIRQQLVSTGVASPGWAGYSSSGVIANAWNAVKTAPPALVQPPAPVIGGGPEEPEANPQPVTPEPPAAPTGGVTPLKPADGERVSGSYQGISWDYGYDWTIANVQVERGTAPDRGPLEATTYGRLLGIAAPVYTGYHGIDGQLPAGTYWWRVVGVPDKDHNGALSVSPARTFTVPAATKVYVYTGTLRGRAGRSARVKAKFSLQGDIRTNDTSVTIRVAIREGRKTVWTSPAKRFATKPGKLTSFKLSGQPKVKRKGKKSVIVTAVSANGEKTTVSGSLI